MLQATMYTLKCLFTIIMMLTCVCAYLLRLASEGVQSILPSPWQGQSPGARGQAWGCVSLSDVLLLVEVKYDVVTHLLYTEMLQEHYSKKKFLWTVITIQHREQSHNSKYNLLSIIEPGPDASHSCFFFVVPQLWVSGRPCCHGNNTRKRRGWRILQRRLWSQVTCSVWLSCQEHSGYTGNRHAPRLLLYI